MVEFTRQTRTEQKILGKDKKGRPRSVMVTFLTLKQEVRSSNPIAAPPKFGAHTPPYHPASRVQRCVKGP